MNRNMNDRNTFMQWINEASFMTNDLHLYLNSHPDDEQAYASFCEYLKRRKDTMKEYARRFGPLTIDTACDEQSCSWKWISGPWPWEKKGGCC